MVAADLIRWSSGKGFNILQEGVFLKSKNAYCHPIPVDCIWLKEFTVDCDAEKCRNMAHK